MATGYGDVQAAVESTITTFASGIGLPGHAVVYALAIAPALWNAFPPAGHLRDPDILAEIATFHALKAAGQLVEQVWFRAKSPVSHVPLNHRWWLLDYQQHLPPALRVACREPGPEAWFARMRPGPLVDAARAILVSEGTRLASMRPRIRAAACVVAARKQLGHSPFDGPSAPETLAAAGINLATAYNAAVRVGLINPTLKVVACASAATVA